MKSIRSLSLHHELKYSLHIVVQLVLLNLSGLAALYSLELHVAWLECCCCYGLGRVERERARDVQAVGPDNQPVELHRVGVEIGEEL